jgi:hypothetical protein
VIFTVVGCPRATNARFDSRAPAIGKGIGVPIRSWLRLGCRRRALRRLDERIEALFFGQFGNLKRAVDADLAVAQIGTNLGCGPYCLGGECDGLRDGSVLRRQLSQSGGGPTTSQRWRRAMVSNSLSLNEAIVRPTPSSNSFPAFAGV